VALATSCAADSDRQLLADFFAEVVAVGTATGARFIRLAEYNPPDLHPSIPIGKRLAVINEMAKSWKVDDRKGPLRQIQKGIRTEVDFTLGYVVREGEKQNIETPLCRKLLTIIHELEAGTRQLDMKNYAELQVAQTDRHL
jgi:2-dehydropantoate 2-reductase